MTEVGCISKASRAMDGAPTRPPLSCRCRLATIFPTCRATTAQTCSDGARRPSLPSTCAALVHRGPSRPRARSRAVLILLLPLTTICVALAGFYVWHRQLIRKRLFEVAEGLAAFSHA